MFRIQTIGRRAVLGAAIYGGPQAGVLATLLGALVGNWAFEHPIGIVDARRPNPGEVPDRGLDVRLVELRLPARTGGGTEGPRPRLAPRGRQ